jgi:hypothetical protein
MGQSQYRRPPHGDDNDEYNELLCLLNTGQCSKYNGNHSNADIWYDPYSGVDGPHPNAANEWFPFNPNQNLGQQPISFHHQQWDHACSDHHKNTGDMEINGDKITGEIFSGIHGQNLNGRRKLLLMGNATITPIFTSKKITLTLELKGRRCPPFRYIG